jgi:3-phytase
VDGDDPAIWITSDPMKSRIIPTNKSEDNQGLSVFNLKGKKLQSAPAEEPNNVDVTYGFPISESEKADLAYAGCRGIIHFGKCF